MRIYQISLFLFILLVSCTTNRVPSLKLLNNAINVSPPTSITTETIAPIFNLTRVIKNTINPTTTLDLIGDGSNSFGIFCQNNSNENDSLCECSFSYSINSKNRQTVLVPVNYIEQNMMRCNYNALPKNINQLSVSIHLKTTDSYSNEVLINFSYLGNTLDLTQASSFVQPIRYQCRDIVFIPYLFDPSIYDPIQSEDLHLSYPIDFYASNLSQAITQYVGSNNNQWNCPPILNPKAYLTASEVTKFELQQKTNMKIYSKTALHGGGKLIYPPNGNVDRSTFYLSKQNNGIFSIPINAMIAPGIVTAQGGSGPQPLGYGAPPIIKSTPGSGQESCDYSDTKIPAGFHWMKLWLFRAGLPPRQYATPGGEGPSINDIVSITCNPGSWSSDPSPNPSPSPHNPVFPQCHYALQEDPMNATYSRSMADLTSTRYLADRVLGTNQCIRFDDNDNPAGFCGGRPGAGCNLDRSDLWKIQAPIPLIANQAGCNAASRVDPMNLCPNDAIKKPYSYNVGTGNLDISSQNSEGSARFDFLFVVTPPSIHTIDMQDISPSSKSLPYQPYRFLSYNDCTTNDPDTAIPPDCSMSNAITNYGLKLHDIGTNGDPPGEDPQRPGVFPVCVLQPDPS